MTSSLLSSISSVLLATALVISSLTAAPSANSTVAHAPFGTITSKPGECVVGDPNTYISPKDLQWIWDNHMKTNVESVDNWVMDHIVKNKGSLNDCVRWDSNTIKLTRLTLSRSKPCWRGSTLRGTTGSSATTAGRTTRSRSTLSAGRRERPPTLGRSDDSLGKIYIGDLDQDGVPQCPDNCYCAADGFGGWSESSGCDGEPFDVSVQPTEGMTGGLGNYNFQQYGLEVMLEHLDEEQVYFAVHETGHSFGLPDFYDMPQPPNFQPCVMWALSSDTITKTDGWMLRRVLENKKPKYDFTRV